jgi:hypothetical protein
MDTLIQTFADDPSEFIPFFAIALGIMVGVIAVVGGIVAGVLQSRDRERTKREVAAYLAEGSISDEQAERLLAAKDTD